MRPETVRKLTSNEAGALASSRLPVWAVACFVASGAAGLLFEVAWSKQVSYLLGSSLHSVATVTAAFLGGLALGARLLGSRLARAGNPARRYALLEVSVGVLGVAVLPILRSLELPVGQLYRAFGGEGAGFALCRLAILFAVLVPPAALMGATLPVLVARVERGTVGSGLAWLYSLNTLGAVAGSLAAGFVFMPHFGLAATTWVAAVLNLAAALVAFAVSRRAVVASHAPRPDDPVAALLPARGRAVLGVAFACSGFAALALQLAWVRLYGLVLGSSVYSFAAVLGVFLAGLAMGSAAVAPLLRRVRGSGAFALLQFGIAASAVAGLHAFPRLPRAMLELGERHGASWTGLIVAQLGLVIPVLALPCMFLGAVFPLATRLMQHGAGGPATGAAYALNTAGTIAGSLVTGFILLPWLGVQGVVLAAAAISAGAGLATLRLAGMPRPGGTVLALGGGLVMLAGALALFRPEWDPVLMSLGTYRPHHAQNLLTSFRRAGGIGDPTQELAAVQRVLFYREGINASVLVATDLEGRQRWMRVGGKIDASTGDMLTQVMVGVLPTVMADSGARTLVVGQGSGFTAAAALAAGAGQTDIVELEPAVVAGSRLFHENGADPLDDLRVTLYVEDARTRLAHGGGRYGLIISEPTNPWIAGVNNLFTVDFYRRVRSRLEPEGVFCQWIQLYELSPETFHCMLASFLEVFPDAHLFCLWRSSDVVLVAAPPGRQLSYERLRSTALQAQLKGARLSAPEQIAEFYVASGAGLAAMVRGAQRNTDDRPIVEYRAPRDLIEVGRGLAGNHPEVVRELPRTLTPPAGGPIDSWPRSAVLTWRARGRLNGADDIQAAAVYAELRAAGAEDIADMLEQERRESLRRARLEALDARARSLTTAGDVQGSLAALESLVVLEAPKPQTLFALAEARRAAGDVRGSLEAAERALIRLEGGERLEGLLLAGMAAQGTGQPARALAWFRDAQRLAPRDVRAYDFEARVLLDANDIAGARRVVERGLTAVPGDATLGQALQALNQPGGPRLRRN